ncbi:GntR family transcriptional regulator [Mesorhizobium sp. SB112]|uniref:GntR family transcriptional regulator n=1 Tax=Mesorhizobium sp. SB112 TaxID=3151853 RepID=UPI003263E015
MVDGNNGGREEIYAQLREEIVTLRRAPGSPISDKLLSQERSISRTPVREALLKLADEGLVQVIPRSGTYVSRINLGMLRDAQFVRIALEIEAVQDAARCASKSDFRALERIIGQQTAIAGQMREMAEFYRLDEQFHRTIFEIGKRDGVWPVLERAKTQLQRMRYISLGDTGRQAMVIKEHQAIISAIAQGDATLASETMRAHIDAAFAKTFQNMELLRTAIDPTG